ncbi:transmembrane protein, putative (macronuclear) [Tetrahymena thermophila SB210]|uniref:Transmembrane protein, putative n=1 Tax=Tetrahymena thermophila (strain SB210) TaxID=312017 RepID=W7XEF8_TETTS|nr:transmembrane protein, putative [Tetrahymena thermophila SB210]EWS71269.1 transmembrane protein, putative [Tetrahymena thermophila SB210]|eukprot:XP_012656201.1 transmembrane protein, putative [Tetrahymena thermophila SB210]
MSSEQKDYLSLLFQIGVLSFTSYASFHLMKVCSKEDQIHQEEMQRVKNAFNKIREYEPDELIEKLNNLYKNEKNQQKYIDCGKFFVKGVISCDAPIVSQQNQSIKLVYQDLRKYDLLATLLEKRVLQQSKQYNSSKKNYVSVFQLQPSTGILVNRNSNLCFVENIRNSKFGKVINFISTQENSSMNSINFASLGIGSVIKVGFEINEHGIKVGDKITVYGKVLFDKINKLIKFENPQHILQDKEEYSQYIDEVSLAGIGVFLFGALTIAQLIFLGNSIFELVKRKDSQKK